MYKGLLRPEMIKHHSVSKVTKGKLFVKKKIIRCKFNCIFTLNTLYLPQNNSGEVLCHAQKICLKNLFISVKMA